MVNCTDCKSEVPSDAKFCSNCGAQIGVKRDVYKVSGDGLVGKVKEIMKDAKVKRIIIKDDKGKVLLSIPVTWGAAGAAALVVLHTRAINQIALAVGSIRFCYRVLASNCQKVINHSRSHSILKFTLKL